MKQRDEVRFSDFSSCFDLMHHSYMQHHAHSDIYNLQAKHVGYVFLYVSSYYLHIFVFIASDTSQQTDNLQSCDLLHVPKLTSLALKGHDSQFGP